jgi:uncharacterized membrane protein
MMFLMVKFDARAIAKVGAVSALTVSAILLFRIPGPGGNVYFHLGETVMLASAVILGRWRGAFVGGISAVLADLLAGAALWAPFSFLIHGFKGYLVGRLSNGEGGFRDAAAMSAGAVVMIASYTLLAGFLYGAGMMPVEFFGDLLQGGFGVITAYPLSKLVLSKFLTTGKRTN